MKTWLVCRGEPLPTDPGNPRLMRMGIIAQMLTDRGHDVTWWSSDFSHFLKIKRQNPGDTIRIASNYRIKLISGVGYKRNISIRRLADNFLLGRNLAREFKKADRPDVILASVPTIEMCRAATDYGTHQNVPVVVDLRDMWPDLFLEFVPKWSIPIARACLKPMFSSISRLCRQATAILGITDGFLEWGLRKAARSVGPYDAVFPHSYSSSPPLDDMIEKAHEFWGQQGVSNDKRCFFVCYFGVIGPQAEIETVADAAEILQKFRPNIRFVICGRGEKIPYLKQRMTRLNNMIFPGFVGATEIWVLMSLAQVGLAAIKSNLNYVQNIPNKIVEYLSAGLPIVSSMRGTVEELLEDHECGITYENGNPESLAEALAQLYDDTSRLAKMSQNAKKLYEANFVAEKVYAAMADHLERIAKESHRCLWRTRE